PGRALSYCVAIGGISRWLPTLSENAPLRRRALAPAHGRNHPLFHFRKRLSHDAFRYGFSGGSRAGENGHTSARRIGGDAGCERDAGAKSEIRIPKSERNGSQDSVHSFGFRASGFFSPR